MKLAILLVTVATAVATPAPQPRTEKLTLYVSGSRAGVVGIYQRHHFQDEARAALVAWADHLARLGGAVGGAEVVPFARRS